MTEYTDEAAIEFIPGQVQPSAKGVNLAGAIQGFFADRAHVGGTLYLVVSQKPANGKVSRTILSFLPSDVYCFSVQRAAFFA
jgi:hypothetical protein